MLSIGGGVVVGKEQVTAKSGAELMCVDQRNRYTRRINSLRKGEAALGLPVHTPAANDIIINRLFIHDVSARRQRRVAVRRMGATDRRLAAPSGVAIDPRMTSARCRTADPGNWPVPPAMVVCQRTVVDICRTTAIISRAECWERGDARIPRSGHVGRCAGIVQQWDTSPAKHLLLVGPVPWMGGVCIVAEKERLTTGIPAGVLGIVGPSETPVAARAVACGVCAIRARSAARRVACGRARVQPGIISPQSHIPVLDIAGVASVSQD